VRPQREVDLALTLLGQGLTAVEVARRTGIPRSTVRDWPNGRGVHRSREARCSGHDLSSLDTTAYAYLLGMYLGDGCISAHARGVWRLRITLDAIYPGIVAECVAAVETVAPGRRVYVLARRDQRSVEVSSYWKHWPCLIPQHGRGPKHVRRIALAEWQQCVVTTNAEPFLRGLIHSDGTRIIAIERKGLYARQAPRDAFKNRSEDILGLFWEACDAVGVHCTRASQTQIAIYSKAAVARLDEFVGPKQ
jgi:hypothetical protein